VEIEDEFGLCKAFAEYLHQRHDKSAWHALADRLLARLQAWKDTKGGDSSSCDYRRDRLSDWAIHALEQAGREDEIIPLCEAEAPKTASYDRLVKRLIAAHRYEDADRWIRKGIAAGKIRNRPKIKRIPSSQPPQRYIIHETLGNLPARRHPHTVCIEQDLHHHHRMVRGITCSLAQ
jgi:hypothetical protein